MIILNVVGARPNLVKIAPIFDAMRKNPALRPLLVHTGQHYDDNLSDVFFRQLNLPKPDFNLGIAGKSHVEQTAGIMLVLEPLILAQRPDLVLVVGDVDSTIAAALVAAKLHVPVAHVEAGLRSFDREMPEEINRIVVDALADLLFTTERSANENLHREGIPDSRIHFVGNVMIDTLVQCRRKAQELNMPARFGVNSVPYAVLTLHRPSNVDRPKVLTGIVAALSDIQKHLPVLFPVHPRTAKRLAEFDLLEQLRALPGLHLIEPLGYLEFLGLLSEARFALTDSGGIQEETTILGVPCLTLRDNTERPITVSQGTNTLVGPNPEAIMAGVIKTLNDGNATAQMPELWDGHAAERIVSVLCQEYNV